jgi:transcriptional regulator with XRE-family HTH domain
MLAAGRAKGGENVRFCDKLVRLRAEKGFSQEGLANLLGVSRQAVSKWESGAAMPELTKLTVIADLFDTSLDYLVRDNVEERRLQNAPEENVAIAEQLEKLSGYMICQQPYEYKSETTLLGLPLVHVHLSRGNGRPRCARGIIAVGDVAFGVVALGGFSVGLIALGGLAFGLLLVLGGISAGLFAAGGLVFGIYAFGGVAVGCWALGGVALASELAIGGVACARVAIGGAVQGSHALLLRAENEMEMAEFIYTHCPEVGEWLIRLLTAAG